MTRVEGTVVVLDTTVLSNYAVSDSVSWLVDTVPTLRTVSAVHDELVRGVDAGYDQLSPAVDALDAGRIPIEEGVGSALRESYPTIRRQLDRGEAEAVVAAIERDETGVLATDDGIARTVARERDVDVTGSVGLLVRGILDGDLSVPSADAWLERWRTDGNYRAPVDSVREALPDEEDR